MTGLSALPFAVGIIALTQAAVYNVDADKAGIASALLNSERQIGVALGMAILAGVATTVGAGSDSPDSEAPVDGYNAALVVGAGILLATAFLALVTRGSHAQPVKEPVSE